MTDKCDAADAEERKRLIDLKEEFDKSTGFKKLMPYQKPIYALYLGVLLLAVS